MKKNALLSLVLVLILLAGCAAGGGQDEAGGTPTPPAESSSPSIPADAVEMTCRIVDGAEEGTLLLAEGEDGPYGGTGIYTLSVGDIPVTVDGQAGGVLTDGMLVTVCWNGFVAESYPAQLGEVYSLTASSEDTDDRCGLYLQVLADLWEVDPGLNESLEELAVDFFALLDLSQSEKAALTWAFGGAHGLSPITGTWEELVDWGHIDGETLTWSGRGCLFTLAGDAESGFTAQKWASGLGAYFFNDCTAQQGEDGSWSYTVGSESIA